MNKIRNKCQQGSEQKRRRKRLHMVDGEYLKFGFKKGEKGSRNNTPNASSIYAQHRHHPSLCAAANHFDSNSKESLQNEVSPSKLISIKRAVVSVLIAKRFDSGNYTKNFDGSTWCICCYVYRIYLCTFIYLLIIGTPLLIWPNPTSDLHWMHAKVSWDLVCGCFIINYHFLCSSTGLQSFMHPVT